MGTKFELTDNGYFKSHGVDIMAFSDFYPAGHQAGVGLIMNGKRIATNGDVRFEPTPGQWQPVPKQLERNVDKDNGLIDTKLAYPDRENHLRGFNPMIFPDLEMEYHVVVKSIDGGVRVSVNLDKPIPEKYVGKLCFNMELFPGIMFGEPWLMDEQMGIFPRQPNGPVMSRESNYANTLETVALDDARADRKLLVNSGVKTYTDAGKNDGGSKDDVNPGYNPIIADDLVSEPYACGHTFVACPNNGLKRFKVISKTNAIKLYDGRMNHNNGWFVLSTELLGDVTENVLVWDIIPAVDEEWRYEPVIQVSQVGYHPEQIKMAVVELDPKHIDECAEEDIVLYKLSADGPVEVLRKKKDDWGDFLRYHYVRFDFSEVKDAGMYQVGYMNYKSTAFKIARDVYDRGVWQPVVEYFLPVQMCHMRVQEKYRVWHGLCHSDDAVMAPVNINHFDGYSQGPSTLTKYQPGDPVPGLNRGGWHDAGDFDLRIESQSGEVYNLSIAAEEFGAYSDSATVDQDRQIVEIHQPDGNNDILEQIEHGLLSIIGGYRSLGRLYRGIICSTLRQYVLLGDPANMTSGKNNIKNYDEDPESSPRWVFTEDNPVREVETASHLAAASRVIRDFRPELSAEALQIALELYESVKEVNTDDMPEGRARFIKGNMSRARIQAAVELYLATGERKYIDTILSLKDYVVENVAAVAWIIGKVWNDIDDESFKKDMWEPLKKYSEETKIASEETPYGIPYRPHIWGAGWMVQGNGVRAYFLHKAFPELFDKDAVFHALDFILGTHPGSNTASFASGVGAKSATVAYGMNRADWSYIPGGVISGTALIQPDFPELLEFPFLWQQGEYVLGGGSSNYMNLVLAAKKLCDKM